VGQVGVYVIVMVSVMVSASCNRESAEFEIHIATKATSHHHNTEQKNSSQPPNLFLV
jgi:hypothetical protein